MFRKKPDLSGFFHFYKRSEKNVFYQYLLPQQYRSHDEMPAGQQAARRRTEPLPIPIYEKDCDCRLCLYYRKKNGCVMEVCPALDIRLSQI